MAVHVRALSDVAVSLLASAYLLNCNFLFSQIVSSNSLPTQKKAANFDKEAKAYQKAARKCDNPACQTSPDDKSKKRPKKCAACEVALYCCPACQTAHWPAHAMLCQELR